MSMSNGFLSQEEMSTMTEIDKGQGDKYAHAQSQYLEKGLVDEQGRYNYKFVEGKVVEVAEADKPTIEEPKAEPTTKVCPYCLSEINIKATKCPHCTSDLAEKEEISK